MSAWPDGWPRTDAGKRRRGEFGKSQTTQHGEGENAYKTTRKVGLQWNDAVRRANEEIRRMGGTLPRIDTAPGDADPGVVVSFRLGNQPVVMPCDRYTAKAQNLAAIAATIEAKRAIPRHGVSTLEREFQGYLALPAGDGTTYGVQATAVALQQTPRQILGVTEEAPLEACEGAYRAIAKGAHPDRPGGSAERMAQLNAAIQAIREGRA